MKKQYILFDLDGTITDSQLGITKSVQYALKHFNIQVDSLDDLVPFIGPPLGESFKQFYNLNEEQATHAIEVYREYYSVKGVYENKLYDGIADCLAALHQEDVQIILATSKPEIFARQILEHFDIMKYFHSVVGANLEGTLCEKIDVMREAIRVSGLENLDQAVMIGDRMFDIDSSNELGMDSIAVLYGFGSLEELQASNPTRIVNTVSELQDTVLNMIQ